MQVISTTPGTGLATSYFNHPEGIASNGTTTLYVADSGNNVIRMITSPGVNTSVVSTIAGNLSGFPGSADNATGTNAYFNNPLGITFGSGNLYVADAGNSTIRQVSATAPYGVTTIAGQAGVFGSADATGTAATFTYPEGIAIDSTNANLYIADTWNCTIRKLILATKAVSTIAGQAGVKGDGDNTTGTSASFNWPEGIAIDGTSANLYVADTLNSAIRQVVLAMAQSQPTRDKVRSQAAQTARATWPRSTIP